MAVKIHIIRNSNDEVCFEAVNVPSDENVFFVNLDTKEAHHPDLLPHPLGKAPPSPPSIEVVPRSSYKCLLHQNERGTITIVPA